MPELLLCKAIGARSCVDCEYYDGHCFIDDPRSTLEMEEDHQYEEDMMGFYMEEDEKFNEAQAYEEALMNMDYFQEDYF